MQEIFGVIDILVKCKSAEIEKKDDGFVYVRLHSPDKSDVFDMYSADDAVSHFGEESVLKHIDEDTIRKVYHFPEDNGSSEINRLNEVIKSLENDMDALRREIDRKDDYVSFEEIK